MLIKIMKENIGLFAFISYLIINNICILEGNIFEYKTITYVVVFISNFIYFAVFREFDFNIKLKKYYSIFSFLFFMLLYSKTVVKIMENIFVLTEHTVVYLVYLIFFILGVFSILYPILYNLNNEKIGKYIKCLPIIIFYFGLFDYAYRAIDVIDYSLVNYVFVNILPISVIHICSYILSRYCMKKINT